MWLWLHFQSGNDLIFDLIDDDVDVWTLHTPVWFINEVHLIKYELMWVFFSRSLRASPNHSPIYILNTLGNNFACLVETIRFTWAEDTTLYVIFVKIKKTTLSGCFKWNNVLMKYVLFFFSTVFSWKVFKTLGCLLLCCFHFRFKILFSNYWNL